MPASAVSLKEGVAGLVWELSETPFTMRVRVLGFGLGVLCDDSFFPFIII